MSPTRSQPEQGRQQLSLCFQQNNLNQCIRPSSSLAFQSAYDTEVRTLCSAQPGPLRLNFAASFERNRCVWMLSLALTARLITFLLVLIGNLQVLRCTPICELVLGTLSAVKIVCFALCTVQTFLSVPQQAIRI